MILNQVFLFLCRSCCQCRLLPVIYADLSISNLIDLNLYSITFRYESFRNRFGSKSINIRNTYVWLTHISSFNYNNYFYIFFSVFPPIFPPKCFRWTVKTDTLSTTRLQISFEFGSTNHSLSVSFRMEWHLLHIDHSSWKHCVFYSEKKKKDHPSIFHIN